MAKYAYARTLQKGQSLNKQLQAFAQFGVPKSNIYVDEKAGVSTSYGELLQVLKRGDLLIIKTLTALGDSYGAISTEWTRLTGSMGADIYVVDMPALDTRVGSDRAIVSSAVVQLLNFCDEKARNQSALQAKGIQSAKQRGVKFGRPTKQYSNEFINIVCKFCKKEITLNQALIETHMKQSSFYYHVKKLKESGMAGN